MKKETILTSLTANTHMRERAAPAEASGQSCGTMFFFHVFLDFVYSTAFNSVNLLKLPHAKVTAGQES